MELKPVGRINRKTHQCDGNCRPRLMAVEWAAINLAADGIESAADRHRDTNQPLAGLTSRETIRAEELAIDIAGWIREHGDELIQMIANAGS